MNSCVMPPAPAASTPDMEGQPSTRFKVVKIDQQRSAGGKKDDGQGIHEQRLIKGEKIITYKRGRWTITDFYDHPPQPPTSMNTSTVTSNPPSNPPSNSNSTPSTPTPHVAPLRLSTAPDTGQEAPKSPPLLLDITGPNNNLVAKPVAQRPVVPAAGDASLVSDKIDAGNDNASVPLVSTSQQQQMNPGNGKESSVTGASEPPSTAKTTEESREQVTRVKEAVGQIPANNTSDLTGGGNGTSATTVGTNTALSIPVSVPSPPTSSSTPDADEELLKGTTSASKSSSDTGNSVNSATTSPSQESDLTTLVKVMQSHPNITHGVGGRVMSPTKKSTVPSAVPDTPGLHEAVGEVLNTVAVAAAAGVAPHGVVPSSVSHVDHSLVENTSGYATPQSVNSVSANHAQVSASSVAIDNKIEQAMDLVKSHLMFAVREEVDVLKDKIVGLMERIQSLETENAILKQAQMGGQHTQSLLTSINISHPTSPINDPALEGTEAPVSSSTPTSMLAITVSTGNNNGAPGATSPQNSNPVTVPGNGGNNNNSNPNQSQAQIARASNPATGSVSPEETSGK